jgi:hypothetical protein
MKNGVFWDINAQFVPHRRQPSRLMLCKISDFHGGDYEEYRLLGYKHPFHTPQETH